MSETFSYTVPANTFFAATKAEANELARLYAEAHAPLVKFCCDIPDLKCCVGNPVNESYEINLGTEAFVWTTDLGELPTNLPSTWPAGLTMTFDESRRTMTISGTPSAPGNTQLTITIQDGIQTEIEKTFNIYIMGITTDDVDDGTEGTAYSYQLESSGGVGVHHYTLASGALPAGLTLSDSGLISGTPTEDGTFNFSVMIQDEDLSSCIKAFDMEVTASVSCPEDAEVVITTDSDDSVLMDIFYGPDTWYSESVVAVFDPSIPVQITAGEPGFLGALDTFLTIQIQGQASGGNVNTLIDATKSWPINSLAGYDIFIVGGSGSGQQLTIASNTATSVTFTAPSLVPIDLTSEYAILIESDDDSGPGRNSYIEFFVGLHVPFAGEYSVVCSLFSGATGTAAIRYVCPCTCTIDWTSDCLPEIGVTEVQLVDQSVPTPSTWDWDFGDGTPHSNLQVPPPHIYNTNNETLWCGHVTAQLTTTCFGVTYTDQTIVTVLKRYRIKNFDPALFIPSSGCGDSLAIPVWNGIVYPICEATDPAWAARPQDGSGLLRLSDCIVAPSLYQIPGRWYFFVKDSGNVAHLWQFVTGNVCPMGTYTRHASSVWDGPLTIEIEEAP